jgi:thiol:disulfide interchange protein DsbA
MRLSPVMTPRGPFLGRMFLCRMLLRGLFVAALALPGLALAAGATPPAGEPVEGTDYIVIDGGQPYRPLEPGIKAEVVEVFAYWCPHCAEFQPVLAPWVRTLPKDVRFTYVPAAFDLNDAFARGFFAAEAKGAVERTHALVYDAVHHKGLLAHNASIDEIAWFYGQQGLGQAAMKAAMTGPAVDALMQRARAFEVGIRLPGTPTMVVNGRYLITPRSHEDALRIAMQLIAKVRAAH